MGKEYRTKDLGEASALLAAGVKLLFLDKDQNFYWFVFDNLERIAEKLSNEYWFGNLQINAKKYNEAMRTLKDRVFAR